MNPGVGHAANKRSRMANNDATLERPSRVDRLLIWNRLRWPARLPVKWCVFGLTVLAVCFPYPSLLIRHIQHWRDPNALIEPEAAALTPLIEELRPILSDVPTPKEALNRVERFVYEKIPYDWDWNTWGTSDYMPTVTEAIEMGREDCDGRAVVAASLLQHFGFEARLVTNFAHVWVQTEHGETMSPGKTRAIVATDRGLEIELTFLKELPKTVGYGIAVFPAMREMIAVAVLWLLLMRGGIGAMRSALTLGFLAGGLFLVRGLCADYWEMASWRPWPGFVLFLVGCLAPFVRARRNSDVGEGQTV